MKTERIIALLISASMALSLAACSKDGGDGKDTAAASGQTTDTATGTAAPSASDSADYSFNYSDGIAENGCYKDVRALDYVTLPPYKEVAIPADKHAVTDEELEKQISSMLSDFATKSEVTDREVRDGDTVNIDYVGSVDGVEFEGGNTKGQGTEVTIGVTSYIDDFLEQLIGHKPGETVNVEVTFPETYPNNPDLASKDALFVTKINHIVENVTPELTDAFAEEKLKEDYGWSTVDEVKNGIRDNLKEQKVSAYLQDYLGEKSVVSEIPAVLVEYQRKAMLSYYAKAASQYSMSLGDMVKSQGYDSVDAFVEAQKADLENAAKQMLILQAVAEDAGLSVTEADVDKLLRDDMGVSSDDALKSYKENLGMPYLMQVALDEAVYDLISGSAVLS